MRNTFLVIKTIHNDEVRVNVDHITSYVKTGGFTTVYLGMEPINTLTSVEDLDQAITELYFMVKKL